MAPSARTAYPGRLLAALAVLIILMLAGVLRGDILHPARWHDSFRVSLGLDLSGGTSVTLRAVPPHGHAVPSAGEMREAVAIMNQRVDNTGFTGAQVQQQGIQLITVSVPGTGGQKVAGLVGTTAQLRFRQVLLCSGSGTRCLPSTSPSASGPATASTAGAASLVSTHTMALFRKLNCADKKWQQRIYGTDSSAWDNTRSQIVACDRSGTKYVLDTSPVTGTQLTSAAAALNSSSQWVVNFSLNGQGSKAFASLTTQMYGKYYDSSAGAQTSVLDQFAIVLDGKVISAPQITQPITGGSSEISNGSAGFPRGQATQLANVLKYGHLPLTFQKQHVLEVSPELGSAQLEAALIAAAAGLGLVIIYSLLYYRGLGIVSASSLAIAAALSYVSIVLLSKYEGLTLDLAGVAGLIVAIGITADSFVVYFERLRDEAREGRSLRTAAERGWARARRTILVADTVSFLAALLLYILAIGDVRGFAFTLGLTTLVDIVVVFGFTKPMVTLLARTRFFGQGHRRSGVDPTRLGARPPGPQLPGLARPAGR